ncbi:uncharacterized protein LOC143081959 [Mytilus galloprovincialis]|uniref:uncharacterized protein LOC143081959 n=1 Tax=Mytilus galloprovincialis TaxID=29158 RepID=UPI003F7B44C1
MKQSLWYLMIQLLLQNQILNAAAFLRGLKKISELQDTPVIRQQVCSVHVVDPNWHNQWYLNGSGIIETDLNVLHAWRKCLNGTGITVAVVDDGIFDHPDLKIDRSLDANIQPAVPSTKVHGTRVAGVIAAKRNNECGTGIAFEAKLADLRILTGSSEPESDSASATILTSSLDQIDIYSNSYIHPPVQAGLYPIGKEVLRALKKGTTEGRNGKGAIYVWSTGNGGHPLFPFGCAYEGFDNNPYVIPVAGVRFNYHKLTTGDSCSSIMVAAFTRESIDTDKLVETSDDIDGCTGQFGRNSAAVPMVSGAIALVLQANPNLSYRDVMHLLVLSSNPNLSFNPNDFKENAVGKKVSKTFGFGLLDIGKLVDMAETWQNVNELTVCRFRSNFSCSLSSNRTENVTFETCKINSLEHVEVYFKVESPRSGQLKLDLLSSSGTISNIIPGRFLDLNRMNMNMTVITVHFWGESSIGKWTLMPGDISGNDLMLSNGTTLEWGLTFYGTKDASPSSPIMSESSTKVSSTHSATISPPVFSSFTSSKRPTGGQTSQQDMSSGGDCEDMPLQDSPEETHVEIIATVVSIVCTVIAVLLVFAVLLHRRKQIYRMATKKSCSKKIDTAENEGDPCEFISRNGSRSTCV